MAAIYVPIVCALSLGLAAAPAAQGEAFAARVPAQAPPPLILGAPSIEYPAAGEEVVVPIETEAGASVSCTADGASASSCNGREVAFTAPEAFSATVTVTASDRAGSTTSSETIPISWFPSSVSLGPDACEGVCIGQSARMSWSSEPASSIDCRDMPGAVEYVPGATLSFLDAADALGGSYPNVEVRCGEAENRIEFFALATDSGTDGAFIPTTHGDFFTFVTGAPGASASNFDFLLKAAAPADPVGVVKPGPLTCPANGTATGYVWTIEGENPATAEITTKMTTGRTLAARELPGNATVTCVAVGSRFSPLSGTVLVSDGVRTTAGYAIGHTRRGAARIALKVRASAHEELEVRAYNTRTNGSGESASTTYGLAYARDVTVGRGTTSVRLGARLRASGFQIIVRRILAHEPGHAASYSRALVIT